MKEHPMSQEFAVEHSGDGARQDSGSAPLAHPETETYPMPPHGWTCFHCGETFANPNLAQAHFGPQPESTPACVLIQERGMLYELRAAQKEAAQAVAAEARVKALEAALRDLRRAVVDARGLMSRMRDYVPVRSEFWETYNESQIAEMLAALESADERALAALKGVG